VVERWLDAAWQWRRRLAVALLLGPLLLVVAGLAINRTQAVGARIWVNTSVALLDLAPDGTVSVTPAEAAAGLLREVVATDSLLDPIIAGAEPGFRTAGTQQQSVFRHELRSSLQSTTDGDHVVVVTIRTDRSATGQALLSRLITEFEGLTVATLLTKASTATPGQEADFLAAQTAVQRAFADLRIPSDFSALEAIRGYLADRMRQEQATARVSAYQHQLDVAGRTPAGDAGMLPLRTGLFAVTDPPVVLPEGTVSRAARLFLLGLLVVAGAQFGLLCLIAFFDQRVRSGSDILAKTGLRYLGSTPQIPSPVYGGGSGWGPAAPPTP
jgi:hypothetical protein